MQNPKISIIIPVYNVAKYLSRCLDSVLIQSFGDFEVLLIDDGSTDYSGAICDEYATRDMRIRVFHKENGGVSSARNLGIDNANGEWLYFVDADDELFFDSLSILADGLSDSVDMVVAGYEEYDEDGNCIYGESIRTIETWNSPQALMDLYVAKYNKYQGYLWNRLLRKSVIDENKLRFDPFISIKEDTLYIAQYLCCANNKTFYNTVPVYKYIKHLSSAMNTAVAHLDNRYLTSIAALRTMYNSIQNVFPNDKDLLNIAIEWYLERLCGCEWRIYVDHMFELYSPIQEHRQLCIRTLGPRHVLGYETKWLWRKINRIIRKRIKTH